MLRLSVVISIKVGGIPPTSYHPCRQYSKPCATPLYGPRPPFFCWPRAIGSRPDYLTFASTSRATHLCSTSMRSEDSAHTLATSTPKNRDSGWSGGKLDWLHQGMQVPKLSLLTSPAPRIGKTSVGTTRRESAFRESLCETTVSVLALQTSTWAGACASPRHVRG